MINRTGILIDTILLVIIAVSLVPIAMNGHLGLVLVLVVPIGVGAAKYGFGQIE